MILYLVKLIYNFFVVLFIGNMLMGLFWKMAADESGEPFVIAYTFRNIIKADLYITIPCLFFILLLNGNMNAFRTLPTSAIKLSSAVLAVSLYSALMYVFIIHPLRLMLWRLATGKTREEFDRRKYKKLSTLWLLFGIMELGPLVMVLLVSL